MPKQHFHGILIFDYFFVSQAFENVIFSPLLFLIFFSKLTKAPVTCKTAKPKVKVFELNY